MVTFARDRQGRENVSTRATLLSFLLAVWTGCNLTVDPFTQQDANSPCVPHSCTDRQIICGEIDDGCGLPLQCGPACTLTRPDEPVLIRGESLPGLDQTPIDTILVARWTGEAFAQIRAQIDERVNRKFGLSLGGLSLGSDELSYVFDHFGPLQTVEDDGSAGRLDADDEILFFAEDAGGPAPDDAWWEGADDTRYQIRLQDPLDDSAALVYLFTFPADSRPDPISPNVNYTRDATSKETSVSAPGYQAHFAANWVLDEIRLPAGEDLIDRIKGRAFMLAGDNETEESWGQFSAYVGDRSGPVRTIREIVGAKTGLTTTVISEFFPNFIRLTYNLRMRAVEHIWQYIDYDSQRGPMTYEDSRDQTPIAIDGADDSISGDMRFYTQVSCPAGRLVHLYDFLDLSSLLNGAEQDLEYFYVDSNAGAAAGILSDGTGDDQPTAWGNHGFHILRTCDSFDQDPLPCPDNNPTAAPCCDWDPPAAGILNVGTYFHPLIYQHTIFPLPTETGPDADTLRQRLDTPLMIQIDEQLRPETGSGQ